MKQNPFFAADILTADQFTRENLKFLVDTAKEMQKLTAKKGSNSMLRGKIMTALFYEPSSRTFSFFIAAMQRLGGGIIPIQGVVYSSVTKGESLPDTVRTFASYSDIVVIRHPEVGSAKIAAEFAQKPIINAGDGVGEHPSQAALDFFTIVNHFGKVEGLTITMVGDLLNGRTIHSLLRILSLYKKVKLNLVSPKLLKLPGELNDKLHLRQVNIYECEKLDEVLGDSDVLYVTRVQKERFTDLGIYEKLKHHYIITSDSLKMMKKDAIIMHPFPRVGEISLDVDHDKRAVYIREQMVNGMYVRMALLKLILLK